MASALWTCLGLIAGYSVYWLYLHQDYAGKNLERFELLRSRFAPRYQFVFRLGHLRIVALNPDGPDIAEILEMIKILWLNADTSIRLDITQSEISFYDQMMNRRFKALHRVEIDSRRGIHRQILIQRLTTHGLLHSQVEVAHIMEFDRTGAISKN